MVSGPELEEQVECPICRGFQILFSGVREASQLRDTCNCPVEPPEITEMKRGNAAMQAALATKESAMPEGIARCAECDADVHYINGVRDLNSKDDTCTCDSGDEIPVPHPDAPICRSCGNKGRDLLGLPCGCGSPPRPPFFAKEIKDLIVMARREGLRVAATLLQSKAVEAFEQSNDPLAGAFRTLAAEIEELAKPKKKPEIDF